MCTEDEYIDQINRLEELTYEELCALKQHCLHGPHGLEALPAIEKALSPHLRARGYGGVS